MNETNENQEKPVEKKEPTEVEKFLFGFLQSLIKEKILKEKGVS